MPSPAVLGVGDTIGKRETLRRNPEGRWRLTPERLREQVTRLLSDEDRLREMSIAARRLAKPDAAERIAREVLVAAHG